MRSIRPTLDKIEKVELLEASPAALLHILLVLDVRTLVQAPHNVGVLARLPEVQSKPYFDHYRTCRTKLVAAYGRLGAQVQVGQASLEVTPPSTSRPGALNLGSML